MQSLDVDNLTRDYRFDDLLLIEGLDEIDFSSLYSVLDRSVGREHVSKIVLDDGLQLKNLDIIKCFPNVLSLLVKTDFLTELSGIERCDKLASMILRGRRRSDFDFSAIHGGHFLRLELHDVTVNEIDRLSSRVFCDEMFLSGGVPDDLLALSDFGFKKLDIVKSGAEYFSGIYAFSHSSEQSSSEPSSTEQPKLKSQPKSPLNTKSDPAQKALNKKLRPRIDKQQKIKRSLQLHKLPEAPLMPFDGSSHTDVHQALPFTREDYFDLVDCTG